MSLYWWIEHTSTIASIPLALGGFGVAFWQLAKTRKASEEARDAADAARTAIARNHLLVLIPQLQRVEEELDKAVKFGSRELVAFWLLSWKWQAGQVRGLIAGFPDNDDKLQKLLQASISAASRAKTDMIDEPTADVVVVTKRVRATVSQVTDFLGEIAATYGNETTGVDVR